MINKKLEKKIIAKLVETYHPRMIYLFGSYAWGRPDETSDIDILVIIDKSEEKFWKRTIAGIRALQGMKIAKDILVYTQAEFEEMAQNHSSLFFRIKSAGRILYEAA
jgi:predicted nucleotidyltransferase